VPSLQLLINIEIAILIPLTELITNESVLKWGPLR